MHLFLLNNPQYQHKFIALFSSKFALHCEYDKNALKTKLFLIFIWYIEIVAICLRCSNELNGCVWQSGCRVPQPYHEPE
jgi:hypothetical protein